MVYGNTSDWFQSFLAGHIEMCWVLFCSSFIPVKCLRWWEQILCLCWWLHIAGRWSQPVEMPAVAASLNRVKARIQKRCNRWDMIPNRYKTKAFEVSRSRTVNPPNGDLVLSWVSTWACPNLDILGVKFDRRLTYGDHVCGIVSRVSQCIGILRLVKRVFVDTSLSLRCYYVFILPIL